MHFSEYELCSLAALTNQVLIGNVEDPRSLIIACAYTIKVEYIILNQVVSL